MEIELTQLQVSFINGTVGMKGLVISASGVDHVMETDRIFCLVVVNISRDCSTRKPLLMVLYRLNVRGVLKMLL